MVRRQKVLRSFTAQLNDDGGIDANGQPILTVPGDIRLFSCYKPSLPIGNYEIDVAQTVAIPDGATKTVQNTTLGASHTPIPQTFQVVASRFSLEADDIHSTYPVSGHADDPRVLPHVVLNDPHLPWERPMDEAGATADAFNAIPWLAVLVFDPSELQVDSDLLQSNDLQQSKTGEVPLTLQQLLGLPNVARTFQKEHGMDTSTSTHAIFLKPDLFSKLVDNKIGGSGPFLSLDRYKYLAHVRNVNSSGGSIANMSDENGLYSVVVSHRTGPWATTTPKTAVAHLISLDGIRNNVTADASTNYVALISLYSWSYQCVPPCVDLPDRLRNLGTQSTQLLRPMNIDNISDEALRGRISSGYTLVRHRLITGEETVALFRGPFSPVPVPYPTLKKRGDQDAGAWPAESFYSTDLQIMDAQFGVMDISYATAWQLGRSMAMADQSFVTALVNLRREAHSIALEETKAEHLATLGYHKTRKEVLSTIPKLVSTLVDPEALNSLRGGRTGFKKRWESGSGTHMSLSMDSGAVQKLYSKHLSVIMKQLMPTSLTADKSGINTDASVNWQVVLNWLMDRIKLANIPAIYLINDPQCLPAESIRYFHVDMNWIAAQIDGALSIGNQVSRPEEQSGSSGFVDLARQEIKIAFARYLKAAQEPAAMYPNGGFMTRSSVVKAFPDLIVSSGNAKTQIVSTSTLSDDILLTLFRRNGSAQSTDPAIVIAQPPHQQRFVIGVLFDETSLAVTYKKIYSVQGSAPSGPWEPTGTEDHYSQYDSGSALAPVFDWGSRLINVPNFTSRVLFILKRAMTAKEFDLTSVMSSAAFALQLNDPLYQLSFKEPVNLDNWAGTGFYEDAFAADIAQPVEKENPSPSVSNNKVFAPVRQTAQVSSRNSGYTALTKSSLPAPQIPPAIRSPPRLITDHLETAPLATIASQMTLSVFANLPGSSTASQLPTHLDHYLDIVFSLQPALPAPQRPKVQVKSVVISFPIGNVEGKTQGNPTSTVPILAQGYDGPGAIMLGNNRFRVGLSYTSQKTNSGPDSCCLVVTLLPRTLTGLVVLANCPNFSFLLREVAVDTSNTDQVPVTVLETYVQDGGTEASVQTVAHVLKQDS